MPKYSSEKREYTVGNYWLGQRSGSPAWYRMWYDERSRRTKRASLNTTDFEEAKELLTEWFITNIRKDNADTQEVLIASVIADYWDNHGRHLHSPQTANRACRYWLDYFGDKSIADITPIKEQEAFHAWLRKEYNLSDSTIKRVLTVGRAAINRAWKRGELSSVPFIKDVSIGQSEPMGRPMEIEEIAMLINEMQNEHVKIFMILMLGTASRPEAILELTRAQCDFDYDIIHLNAKGRTQTKKYRPTVKMPQSIKSLLLGLDDGYLVNVKGKKINAIRSAWRTARARAGFDSNVQPYGLRHTMARWLRAQGVNGWEVAAQLGHKQQGLSTTEIYAPFDPSYLSASVASIDIFFAKLRAKCAPVDELLK